MTVRVPFKCPEGLGQVDPGAPIRVLRAYAEWYHIQREMLPVWRSTFFDWYHRRHLRVLNALRSSLHRG